MYNIIYISIGIYRIYIYIDKCTLTNQWHTHIENSIGASNVGRNAKGSPLPLVVHWGRPRTLCGEIWHWLMAPMEPMEPMEPLECWDQWMFIPNQICCISEVLTALPPTTIWELKPEWTAQWCSILCKDANICKTYAEICRRRPSFKTLMDTK